MRRGLCTALPVSLIRLANNFFYTGSRDQRISSIGIYRETNRSSVDLLSEPDKQTKTSYRFSGRAGVLFRATGVHARALQRHVPDGRVLPEQDARRGAHFPGHTGAVHVHHVLHRGPEPQVRALHHGHAVHNARQSGGRLVR